MAMVKKAAVLFGVLLLFSCGVLPEKRPEDWDSRTDFSDKRYRGSLFNNWYDVTWEKTIQADGNAIGIDKLQRWKASGMASSVGKPIYFVLRAENNMVVTLDWWYSEDKDIDIDFKRVRETQVDNYGYSEKQQILMGKNDYLVIQISSRSSAPLHWDIGFNVR